MLPGVQLQHDSIGRQAITILRLNRFIDAYMRHKGVGVCVCVGGWL